jgi:hypothetical protein
MKFTSRLVAALVAAPLILAATGCVVAPPPPPPAPAHHPAYLHALTDLRDARWNLEHRPGDAAVSAQEDVAIVEIDRAINDAKAAAMEDGKNIYQHPPEDARLDFRGRLHHADELLHKARNDVAQGESNGQAVELRNRVIGHIDAAIQATQRAIRLIENGA